jgi:subtilisin family serine protease
MFPKKFISIETSKLLFENTTITIHHQLSHFRNGDQVIIIYFKDPTPGIWTITLKSHIYLSGEFNAWLPMKNWIEEDTFFLNSNPNYTVTTPGTLTSLISVGAYNHRDGSLFINSSRGPSRTGKICPDLVAPGVNIKAPWLDGTYNSLSGTSISSAIVSGCAALFLEWGVVRGNDPSMNTHKIKYYLIAGARREQNTIYPNNTLGYGKLDLYESFNMLKF